MYVNGYSSTSYPTGSYVLLSRNTSLSVSGTASATLATVGTNYGVDGTGFGYAGTFKQVPCIQRQLLEVIPLQCHMTLVLVQRQYK